MFSYDTKQNTHNNTHINTHNNSQKNKIININPLKPFTFKDIKSRTKPKTIKQICEIYKKDITGKDNLPLFNSCKINQYCRKYKCKDIDKKFKKAQIQKLGINYNTLLMASIHSKCPPTMADKSRKRCYSAAMSKFYKDNELGDIYNKVLECDKITCGKEKQIFNTNLFRVRTKKNKQIRIPKQLNIEDLPDKEMIEITITNHY
jgi:hypothetical protein